jgi:hypothetical protein
MGCAWRKVDDESVDSGGLEDCEDDDVDCKFVEVVEVEDE